ncbi:MAG: response regulator transcription factor [Chloroflexi bacterium]|nr:response regulator transcription factor [Chloroflexota bacterium]
MAHILVVDDEPLITESLHYSLRREGFEVSVAHDGEDALRLAESAHPDLVVLDVIMPKIDGMQVCRKLRATNAVPVIMLTARGEEIDRITGLEMGADDYLPKPFSFRELLARIRANLRRVEMDHRPVETLIVRIGSLTLDHAAHRLLKNETEITLSAREFDLLKALMSRAGQAIPRSELLNLVWGENWFGDTRTLDVHIRWLRLKIEDDPADPRYIQTVRGMGYRFAGPEEFENRP